MQSHKNLTTFVAVLVGVLLGITVIAGPTGHYFSGFELIKCGTLPPPGMYGRVYLGHYSANNLMDHSGDRLDVDFNLDVTATVLRYLWVTDLKLFGADYGVQALVPIQTVDLDIDTLGISDHDSRVGDIFFSPFILGWHGPHYDTVIFWEMFVPTGKYDKDNQATIGKGFWTVMFSAGGTYYFDDTRKWSASILAAYEVHSKYEDMDVTPGNDFHFEWGVGHTYNQVLDIGIGGFCHWQVSDDRGSDVTWDSSVHDQAFGIGPQISYFYMPWKMGFALSHEWEFAVRDRPRGQLTSLTITKAF